MPDDNSNPQGQPSVDTDKLTQDITEKVSSQYEEKLREIESSVEEKTQKLTEEKVSKMKEELINGISGGKKPRFSWEAEGRDKPKDWGEVINEAGKTVDQKVDEKLTAWQEAQKKQTEKQQEQEGQRLAQQKMAFSKQWYDLVQTGKMPAPDPQIMDKLLKGETVTEAEANKDRGLQEYRKLVKTTLENQGATLKETYYEKYSQEPAGMNAPVFGSDNAFSVSTTEEPYTYEDVHNA